MTTFLIFILHLLHLSGNYSQPPGLPFRGRSKAAGLSNRVQHRAVAAQPAGVAGGRGLRSVREPPEGQQQPSVIVQVYVPGPLLKEHCRAPLPVAQVLLCTGAAQVGPSVGLLAAAPVAGAVGRPSGGLDDATATEGEAPQTPLTLVPTAAHSWYSDAACTATATAVARGMACDQRF